MNKIKTRRKSTGGKAGFIFLSLIVVISIKVSAQNLLPYNYWTFEGNNPLDDAMNNNTLNPVFFNSTYSINTNPSTTAVGNSLNLSTASKILVASSPLILDTAITVELLYKSGPDPNQTVQFINRRDGALLIRLGYPTIRFSTTVIPTGSSSPVNDNFSIDLRGIGRGSYGYYFDQKWHHLVFRYNAKTGAKEIWVDGQCPIGFQKTVPPGKFAANASNSNNNIIDLNTNTDYYKFVGDIDEVALYKFYLPENIIYKHYNEFKQGNHYSFNNATITPPTPDPVTTGINPSEYAPGHPNVTVSAIDQLKAFPTPRYKPSNTLFPNVPLFNPAHVAGFEQPNVSYKNALTLSKELQRQMVTNFNYTLVVSSNTGHGKFTDTTTFDGAWIKMANDNPSWKTSAISYWDQIRPDKNGFTSSDAYVGCRCLPDNSYLRNAAGQFLDRNGNVISYKVLSPETALDSILQDGNTQKIYVTNLTNALTRPLDLLMENGEVITHWTENGLAKDPNVLAAKNASGLDWHKYIGRKMKGIASSYMDRYRNIPKLSSTWVLHYQITAHPANWDWSETKSLNSLRNGMRYSSGDIYVQYPFAWLDGSGMAKGWEDLIDQRYEEITAGDKLFSPVISPGWSYNEESTLRPAQWLGFLKAVAITGAENFHTGYFSEIIPPQLAENYIWQISIPSYVQALTSRYEDILRNGFLMDGDVPARITGQTGLPGYQFHAGDVRKLVAVRKHNIKNEYVISGTIQNNSNMIGNSELDGPASINLDGQTLKFNIRRQGSTYIYNKTNPSSPVFYQLDGWHENTHPYYWSKTFELEAELFDNNNPSVSIKTEVPSGTASGDFTNYNSFITFNSTTNVEYRFQPRGNTTSTHYLWVLARSVDGTNTGFNVTLDNGAISTINCVNDQNWKWYRFESTTGQPISFSNLSIENHILSLSSINDKIQIDKITITNQSGAYYSNEAAPCNIVATANITPLGSTTLCSGNSVSLTANTGTAYLWSTGATTKTINVNGGGTYTVQVFNGAVSAISSPVIVTVNALPSSGVTASGPLNFCLGDSVMLTSNEDNATYLWSPGGGTTKSIIVKNSGTYNLVVTNASSCTAVSQPITITASNTSNTPSTITPSGATTFCDGATVSLTANSGSGYIWSNGATTQTIVAAASGNYTVNVVMNGCLSLASAPVAVVVKPRPSFTVTPSGPLSFCNGGSVTLNVSNTTANRFIWIKDGSTLPAAGVVSPSYTITTPGTYAVRVQMSNCAKFSQAFVVTVPCRAGETLGVNGFEALAYPNPFEDKTTISVSLLQPENVSINIYDINGRLVDKVANGFEASEGLNEFKYDAAHLGKGIYFAVINAGAETRRIKIASLK